MLLNVLNEARVIYPILPTTVLYTLNNEHE